MQPDIGSKTDIGRVRKNNEDTCRVVPELNLYIISDGMGGQAHGELASAIAGDTIVAHCMANEEDPAAPYGEVLRPDLSEKTKKLASAVRLANRRIHEASIENPLLHGMGATVVTAWLEAARLSLVHVGDSRAYLLRSGALKRLTSDHTLVAEQVRRGLVTPEEAHLSKMQNVLIRALGVQEDVELDATECVLSSNDILLLCTDGLTRMVEDSDIARILLESPDAQTSAGNLVALANQHGGVDNVSAIVVHIAEAS
ncbi:MAG: Stp1/IreP family PP2C-type Ser/Thr phosphatase [Candidatus Acidiferrales bacterium]|jgi:protein phosphatase